MGDNAVAFDTLKYSKMLSDGGVENSDIHSASLCATISQNIYLKYEVDKMIEDALKRFDERTLQMRTEMKADMSALRLEMRDMRLDLERKISRMTFNVVTILGGLYLFVGAITTFIHVSLH